MSLFDLFIRQQPLSLSVELPRYENGQITSAQLIHKVLHTSNPKESLIRLFDSIVARPAWHENPGLVSLRKTVKLRLLDDYQCYLTLEMQIRKVAADPKNYCELVRLGNLYKRNNPKKKFLKNLSNSEQILKTAFKIAPLDPFVLASLGDLYRAKKGMQKEADGYLQKAAEIIDMSEQNSDTLKLKAFILASRADLLRFALPGFPPNLDEATKLIKNALTLSPEVSFVRDVASALKNLGKEIREDELCFDHWTTYSTVAPEKRPKSIFEYRFPRHMALLPSPS